MNIQHSNSKRIAIQMVAFCALMLVCGGCRTWCPGSACHGSLCKPRMQPPAFDAIADNAGYSQTNWTSLDDGCQWDSPVGYETHETMEYEPASLPIAPLRQIAYEQEPAIDEVPDNQRNAQRDRVEAEALAVAEALAIALIKERSGGPEYVEVEVENLQ